MFQSSKTEHVIGEAKLKKPMVNFVKNRYADQIFAGYYHEKYAPFLQSEIFKDEYLYFYSQPRYFNEVNEKNCFNIQTK